MRLTWLLIILLLLAGCARVQNPRFLGAAAETPPGVAIDLSELPENPTVGTASQLFITVTREGRPVEGAEVQVEGNMTHAGMEPLFMEATEVAGGEYEAAIEWTMGGEWFLRVRATLPDGSVAEERVSGFEVRSP
ncbi:MAG TPA: FixH family protein [Ardenticatenaceae bacterium]|jgi:hypothetical protein